MYRDGTDRQTSSNDAVIQIDAKRKRKVRCFSWDTNRQLKLVAFTLLSTNIEVADEAERN